MQIEFNNEKNSKAAHGALKAILIICFWLSTISSSVSLAIFSYSLSKSLIGNFCDFIYLSDIVAWASVAAVVRFCYIVDFLIIHIAGTYFATDTFAFVAARNGVFTSFKTLRKFNKNFNILSNAHVPSIYKNFSTSQTSITEIN